MYKMHLTLLLFLIILPLIPCIAYLKHKSILFFTQLVKNRNIFAHQPLNPLLLRYFPDKTVDISQRYLQIVALYTIQLHQAR